MGRRDGSLPGEDAVPATWAPAPPAPSGAGGAAGFASPYPPYLDGEFSEIRQRRLRDYLQVLRKYRWLALACFLATFGLAVLVTMLTPRVYSAATRLQIARQGAIQLQLKDNVLAAEDSDRNVNGASSFLATQVASLRSRDLAERVIRSHRLAQNPAFVEPRGDRGGLLDVGGALLGTLRPRGLDAPGAGDARDRGEGPGTVDGKLLDRYQRWLSVQDVRGTDLIEISFTTPSASLSALLAAAHTQAYLESNEEARLSTDVTAKEFLSRQLADARAQVERSEDALREFSRRRPDVAVNQEQKIAQQKIAELSTLVTQAEGQRVGLQTEVDYLSQPGVDQMPYFLASPGIQKLHPAYLDLKAQEAALKQRLGPNHPQMLELRQQMAELQAQIRSELIKEASGTKQKLAAARLREQSLRGKLGKVEKHAIELGDLGAEYDALRTQVTMATTLRDTLLRQQVETAVNSELAPTNVRVIERAEVPRDPSKPNVPLNLSLGLVAGMVLAMGAAFVCDAFDNSVKSSQEVEELLGIPALATIPNFTVGDDPAARRVPALQPVRAGADDRLPGFAAGADDDTGWLDDSPLAAEHSSARAPSGGGAGVPLAGRNALPADDEDEEGTGPTAEVVVVHEPWSPIAEAFRSLRTAVLFSTPARPPKVILLTSASAGEGKTVNSVNLVATLAESGSRVLLIDVDMRHPSCHRALGVDNVRGLSSFLAGRVELDEAIQQLDRPRISFIPAGPTPPNPAELVGSQRMRDALERLRGEYDFVILDTPPVMPVTDAVVLSREADGVVLVVKGHDTPRELIKRARDNLAQANAHLLGAVINNVDLGWGDLYFYNRYYGYYGRAPGAEERAA